MAKVDIKPQVPDCSGYSPTPRSLQASTLGIEKARKAFKQTLWTQEYLASEVGIQTRQPIWKFFAGKPIERHIFLEICFKLHLNWQEIAGLETESSPTVNKQVDCSDIGVLVQLARVRHRDKIQAQCGTIRLLDVAQLIELNDIYVSVNVLEALPSQNWIDISNLQSFSLEESNNFYCDQISAGIPALKVVSTYSKLMLLGKPGSGKTTFLQHIALQCSQGEFLPERLPIFIRLKNFVEDVSVAGNFSLLSYITQELGRSNISVQQVETLLNHGKGLILLDGLDEVQKEYKGEVLKQLRKLSEEYYKNHFIITCRVASQQYCFEGFTDVEIADFDQPQIEAFVQKWFVTVGKNSRQKGLAKATQFMQQLQLSENRQIRELARNPLLLNLACSVFQATLQFPVRRSDLYKQGLDILLVRWDEARGIERDEIYRHLSLSHKIKLLSQIAAIDFEQGHYFFAQSNVQQYITDYLRTLPNAHLQPEELQLNSEAVLKSISVQHGLLVERAREIYSFSHLTFQEYLTARNFVATSDPQILDKNLVKLVSHMHESRWHEVFLLTTGMLANADALMQLMQQHSNNLMATDELQQFLVWLHQKSLSVEAPYKSTGIHAFYLTLVLPSDLTLARNLSLALAIDPRLAGNLAPDLALDLALTRVLSLSHAMPCDPVEQVLVLSFALPDERTVSCDPRLQRSLQQLKEQLPALDQGRERLKEWWSYNGQAWANKLRCLILQYRNIGHQWQFSKQQKQDIQQYYAAHQLLVDCLNSAPKMTPQVRKEIEETLLLPITEIEY